MHGRISWLMPEQMGPASDVYQKFAESFVEKIEQAENEEQFRFNLMNGLNGPMGPNGLPFNMNPMLQQVKRPPPLRFEPQIMEKLKEEKLEVLKLVKGIEEMSPIALVRGENPASCEGLGYDKYKSYRSRSTPPWITRSINKGTAGLHEEIIDFHNWIMSTPEEYTMRHDVVLRVEEAIKQEFPGARVEVFGSFQTGLYLPTSDIDMVVFGEKMDQRYGNPQNGPHYRLQDRLLKQGIAERYTIKVIDSAAVPIIKMRDLITDIKVDISFNMPTGVNAIALVKGYIRQYPALRYLVLVLKQFLLQRDMNEVWTGGISSYGLILMVVSFLQHQLPEELGDDLNLGVLLIKFLQFYGMEFNYSKCCIRVRNGGEFMKKEDMAVQMKEAPTGPKYAPNFLSIEDPLTPSNDVGRASHGAENVKEAFLYAYRLLDRGVSPQALHYPDDCSNSILGRIILITDEVHAYRNWVMRHWKEHVPRLQPPAPPAPEPKSTRPQQGSAGGTDPSDDSAEEEAKTSFAVSVSVTNNNRQVTRTKNEVKVGQPAEITPTATSTDSAVLQGYSSEDVETEDDHDDQRSGHGGEDDDDYSKNDYDRGYDYDSKQSRNRKSKDGPGRYENGRSRVRTNSANINPLDAGSNTSGRPARSSQSDNSINERSDDHSATQKSPNANPSPSKRINLTNRLISSALMPLGVSGATGLKKAAHPGERTRKSDQGHKDQGSRTDQSYHSRSNSGPVTGTRWEKRNRRNVEAYRHEKPYDDRDYDDRESINSRSTRSRRGSDCGSSPAPRDDYYHGKESPGLAPSARTKMGEPKRVYRDDQPSPHGNVPQYHSMGGGHHHRGYSNRYRDGPGRFGGPPNRGSAAMDDPETYRSGGAHLDHGPDHRRSDRYNRSGGMGDNQRRRPPKRDSDLYQPRKSNDYNDRHRDRDMDHPMDQPTRRPLDPNRGRMSNEPPRRRDPPFSPS